MIKFTLALMLIACHPPGQDASMARKINLGKQAPAITLAAGLNHNVAIAGPTGNTTTMLRFTPNASGSTMTGMDASTVSDGDLFVLRNESTTATLTLTDGDVLSLAANRFALANDATFVLPPLSGALVEYDATLGWTMPIATAGSPTFSGKLRSSGTTAPTVASCGTSPVQPVGTDTAGKFTTGSAATTCTLTFSSTWTTVPNCIVAPEGNLNYPTYTTSATAITMTVDVASTVYNYICVGR